MSNWIEGKRMSILTSHYKNWPNEGQNAEGTKIPPVCCMLWIPFVSLVTDRPCHAISLENSFSKVLVVSCQMPGKGDVVTSNCSPC